MGPSIVVTTRNSPVAFEAMFTLPFCGDSVLPTSLNSTWTVMNGVGSKVKVVSQSRDPSVFLLAPYALDIATYTVKVRVVGTHGGQATSASVSVVVMPGPVVAVVAGGSSRTVPASGPILLDGSESYDSNEPNHASAGEVKIPSAFDMMICLIFCFYFVRVDLCLELVRRLCVEGFVQPRHCCFSN